MFKKLMIVAVLTASSVNAADNVAPTGTPVVDTIQRVLAEVVMNPGPTTTAVLGTIVALMNIIKGGN